MIGEAKIESGEIELDDDLLAGVTDTPNAEQVEAIRKALGSDVTYLWGPPGTGKTTTVACIVEGFYRQGYSVLIVSNTNIAVDMALEKVCQRLNTKPDFHEGKFLRHGPVVKPELERDFGEQVILDRVVARLGRRLQEEKETLEAKVAQLDHEAKPIREAVRDYERLKSAEETQHSVTSRFSDLQKKDAEIKASIARLRELRQQKKADLERAEKSSALGRFFRGLNPDHLRRELRETNRRLVAQEDTLSAIAGELKSAASARTKAAESVMHLRNTVSGHPPLESCRRRLAGIDSQIEQLKQQIRTIQEQLEKLREEVIKSCRVLATTVYRTYLKGQVERTFDVVVIDEASMLMLPMVFYAAGLATKQVVVAGDFRQLPPIVMSDAPEAKEWLKTDVFYKSGVAWSFQNGQLCDELTPLRRQYRMHPSICNFISKLFYSDHPLETDESVLNREPLPFPLGESQFIYLNTSAFNPWCAFRVGTYSRYNLLHALIVRNIVWFLHDKGYFETIVDRSNALGVVSPFAAQTRLIKGLIAESSSLGEIAGTVHRFQGNEKANMIIDLTEATGTWPSKFLRASRIEEEGARLLNVAFSRAKDRILLIADFDYLRKKYRRDTYTCRILDFFETCGDRLEPDRALEIGPDDWLNGLDQLFPGTIQLDINTAGIFDEGTFYPAFKQDIQSSEESILIFSPFLTDRGAGRWIDILRERLRRGVHIRIVTKPPVEQRGAMSEDELNEILSSMDKMGVVLDLRAKVHEKFAIIDNRILWHGSLNILSHKDTSESMLRIPTQAGCDLLAKLVTIGAKGDDSTDYVARENPACPQCNGLTVLRNGRYGIYFECSTRCGGKVDPKRSSRQQRGGGRHAGRRRGYRGTIQGTRRGSTRIGESCPLCGAPLVKKSGRRGEFISCSSYPECPYSRDA